MYNVHRTYMFYEYLRIYIPTNLYVCNTEIVRLNQHECTMMRVHYNFPQNDDKYDKIVQRVRHQWFVWMTDTTFVSRWKVDDTCREHLECFAQVNSWILLLPATNFIDNKFICQWSSSSCRLSFLTKHGREETLTDGELWIFSTTCCHFAIHSSHKFQLGACACSKMRPNNFNSSKWNECDCFQRVCVEIWYMILWSYEVCKCECMHACETWD